jgi:very-short-patch-repair endonuclease
MKLPITMPMYYGAKPELFEFAKRMRYAPTPAEHVMWEILNTGELSQYKFRRQHPIGNFIADFYSHRLVLVIEIDGGYHLETAQKEFDIIRDEDMHRLGISVLRLKNEEVISGQETVMRKLKSTIVKLAS